MKRISREAAIRIIRHYAYVMDREYYFRRVTIKETLEYLRNDNPILLKTGAKITKSGRFYYIYGYAADKSDMIF